MTLRTIVKVDDDNPVLRGRAQTVPGVSRRIRDLMDDMVETMRDAEGVGLAAPQVGLDLQVIVVEVPEDLEEPDGPKRLWTLANPRIVARSEAMEEGREACLSIPDLFGDVPRHVDIVVEAVDRFGRTQRLELSGFEARVFQHEIDHLDGILYPDRVSGPDKLYYLEEDAEGNWVKVPVAAAGR